MLCAFETVIDTPALITVRSLAVIGRSVWQQLPVRRQRVNSVNYVETMFLGGSCAAALKQIQDTN